MTGNVPAAALAAYRLGVDAARAGDLTGAEVHYRQAIDAAPAFSGAWLNLGNVLAARSRIDEALDCYHQALKLRPDYALARYNLGNALLATGRFAEAREQYRRVLAGAPEDVAARLNLGIAHLRLGDIDAALACLERVTAAQPRLAVAWSNLGKTWHAAGRPEAAISCLARALELRPDPVNWSSLLLARLYLHGNDPQAMADALRGYADLVEAPQRGAWRPHDNPRIPSRRLRIGYVSADFRRHSVARFIEPVLAAHDRQAFEVFCYYNHELSDEVSGRIAATADRWIPCHQLSDEELAGRIEGDGIDILVDLSGHTRDNRLPVFARRPAPVQVTWLGYPGSTGLAAIDYRLCTSDTDSPGAEEWHSEQLWRLPGSLWCYRPPADMAAVPVEPPLLARGHVTFGSLNRLSKLSPATLAAWCDILRRLPDARLEITGVPQGSARTRLRELFARAGIAPRRVSLHDRLPESELRELFSRIDIALDCYPYNGTTTSCDLLSAGIPLIALKGSTSVARAGFALLRQLGMEQLVAGDEVGYVALAVSLAGDPQRLAGIRRDLRARFAAS
ncbi:MAG: tetratricopeptide repeat protein, partial [Gammaproteobacteria bacterium]|nr:tetratricopeptide repeat protein [Gammaproteobacteria bacterium]